MSKHHGLERLKGINAFCSRRHKGGADDRFGRMFHLPPLYLDPGDLINLGALGGPMDGGAVADRTATVPVGHVFFGQFVDHDITLDITSSLATTADINEVNNVRTPALDLDSIYGMGPEAHNYLYYDEKPPSPGTYNQAKLLTAEDGTAVAQLPALRAHDLSRTAHGTAIIGDFRNDENRILSQLQLAMIRFNNYVAEKLNDLDPALTGKKLYEETRRIVTWHYQWVVITDFLVKMCGRPVLADILGNGRKFYCVDPHQQPYIPIEFSVAAYRFGHSMIPQSIQIQAGDGPLDLFGPTLGTGFRPLDNLNAIVEWGELVDTGVPPIVQMAQKLNTQLAPTLLDLPFIPVGDFRSLASRNLLRGQVFLLPSGENVAGEMGRDPAEIQNVSDAAQALAGAAIDLTNGTPLWFYILMEAEEIGRETNNGFFDPGEGLGPVGARIVAETILGLIELDERSFLAVNRNWRPSDDPIGPAPVNTLGDILSYTFP